MNALRLSIGTTIIILLSLLSSCSHPLKHTLGSTAIPGQRIALRAGSEQTWQTKHLIFNYTMEERDNHFLFTGTVSIKDWVLNSYPIAKSLDVYVNLLNSNGVATSIQNLSLLVPAYTQVNNSLPFKKQLPKDRDISSIAFSYWGTFRQSGILLGDGDELEIYHNPFQK